MTTIRLIDEALLAGVCEEARASPRQRKNYNFHFSNDDPAHRLLNAIEPGSYVMPHRHLAPAKDETILVLRGRLGVVVFDDDGVVVEAVVLEPSGRVCGIDIPHGVYHTVFACEPGTVMFEAKGGPFVPLTPDERAAWAPEEGSPEVAAYLGALLSRVRAGRATSELNETVV